MTNFVSDREIYVQVVRDRVPLARQRLWIATADIKDMYVSSTPSGEMHLRRSRQVPRRAKRGALRSKVARGCAASAPIAAERTSARIR